MSKEYSISRALSSTLDDEYFTLGVAVGIESNNQFAEWLTRQMVRRGWNKAEFARRVGVSSSRITDWTNGKRIPSIENVDKLADTLGLPTRDVAIIAGLIPDEQGLDPNSDRDRLMGMLEHLSLADQSRVQVLESLLTTWANQDSTSNE